MGDNSDVTFPPKRVNKAQIDTAKPFESVKAAISMFGERVEDKRNLGGKLSREIELHHDAEEDLSEIEEQRKDVEAAMTKATPKLEEVKKSLTDLLNAFKEKTQMSAELTAARLELKMVEEEAEKLKKEILGSSSEESLALKRSQEALAMAEGLRVDISTAKESLEVMKLACIEANRRRSLIPSSNGGIMATADAKNSEIQALQSELGSARDAEMKGLNSLEKVKSELSRNISVLSLSARVEEAKLSLVKVTEEVATLKAEAELLRKELALLRERKGEVSEREANAKKAVGALSIDLSRVKAELAVAKEAESGLSHALGLVKAEAEEAQNKASLMRAEAVKAKASADEARGATKLVEGELEIALKEADGAIVAENVALGRLKEAMESKVAKFPPLSGSGITLSQGVLEFLKGKEKAVNSLAELRVAASLAQAEAARASEAEALIKLKALNENVANMQILGEETLHRAEQAQAAKSALEKELQRLREKEHQKKEQDFILLSQQTRPRNTVDLTTPQPPSTPLSTKPPSPESSPSLIPKKKPFLPRFGLFRGSRKDSIKRGVVSTSVLWLALVFSTVLSLQNSPLFGTELAEKILSWTYTKPLPNERLKARCLQWYHLCPEVYSFFDVAIALVMPLKKLLSLYS